MNFLSLMERYISISMPWGPHQDQIYLLTAIMSGVMASVLLLIWYKSLRAEKWALFLGFAFGIFTAQYTFYYLDRNDLEILGTLGSPLNNLFFLAAGMILLSKKKWAQVFPWWAVILAIASFYIEWQRALGIYYRLPDALFSAFCLSTLGWAMFRNIYGPRNPWAWLCILGALIYGVLNLVFAANPILTNSMGLDFSGFDPRFADQLPYGPPILSAIDCLVFAVMFLCKIGLFFGILFLIMKCMLVISPGTRSQFEEVTHGTVEYFDPEGKSGILKVFGESVNADLVVLCIKLPGLRENRIAWWGWSPSLPLFRKRKKFPLVKKMPLGNSVTGTVFENGKEIDTQNWRKDLLPQGIRPPYEDENLAALVTVPVFYHGAIVATLNLQWKRSLSYTATAVLRIRQMANFLAPIVQARRYQIAVNTFGTQLDDIATQELNAGGMEHLKKLTESIHDIMAPLATLLSIRVGFRRYLFICDDEACEVRQSRHTNIYQVNEYIKSKHLTGWIPVFAHLRHGDRTKSSDLKIAKMALVVREKGNPAKRATLARDYLHRRSFAILLCNAILDRVQAELSSIIDQLQLKLNSGETETVRAWFQAIEEAVLRAGPIWIAVQFPWVVEGDHKYGKAEHWAQIEGLFPIKSDVEQTISVYSPRDGNHDAKSFIRLNLRSGTELWLGLSHGGFGDELKIKPSPWRIFLDRLAASADLALVRIEKQQLERKASQLELEATKSGIAKSLIHSLGNIAAVLVNGSIMSEKRIREQNYDDAAEFLQDVRKTAEEFRRTASSITKPKRNDLRREIPFREAVLLLKERYEPLLKVRSIELKTSVHQDLVVRLPLETVYLALANLVDNAMEAIDNYGIIVLETEQDAIGNRCHITDNGCGIDDSIKNKIFELGFSKKKFEGGSGFGLHTSRTNLQNYNGDLIYDSAFAEGTRFTIIFP